MTAVNKASQDTGNYLSVAVCLSNLTLSNIEHLSTTLYVITVWCNYLPLKVSNWVHA